MLRDLGLNSMRQSRSSTRSPTRVARRLDQAPPGTASRSIRRGCEDCDGGRSPAWTRRHSKAGTRRGRELRKLTRPPRRRSWRLRPPRLRLRCVSRRTTRTRRARRRRAEELRAAASGVSPTRPCPTSALRRFVQFAKRPEAGRLPLAKGVAAGAADRRAAGARGCRTAARVDAAIAVEVARSAPTRSARCRRRRRRSSRGVASPSSRPSRESRARRQDAVRRGRAVASQRGDADQAALRRASCRCSSTHATRHNRVRRRGRVPRRGWRLLPPAWSDRRRSRLKASAQATSAARRARHVPRLRRSSGEDARDTQKPSSRAASEAIVIRIVRVRDCIRSHPPSLGGSRGGAAASGPPTGRRCTSARRPWCHRKMLREVRVST